MLHAWLVTSMQRVYPRFAPCSRNTLRTDVARNEFFSCQVAVRHEPAGGDLCDPKPVRVEVSPESPWTVRVRKVGYIPVAHASTGKPADEVDGLEHLPGFVPDPLLEQDTFALPCRETHAFWLSLRPARPVAAGRHVVTVKVIQDGTVRRTLKLLVTVHDIIIRPRRGFSVIHWFYNDSLLDFHGCQAFDQRYWRILPNYFRNLAEHGQDTVYIPVFTPPLDGVKRPTQLLRVTETEAGRYAFDWRDVRRYLALAKACGLRKFEWTHLFTQWGARQAIRIYHGQGCDKQLLWPAETPATGEAYRNFLSQFLPAFRRFLTKEKLLANSFFHLSDEPHADQQADYRRARLLLKELAPWMKVMDALSDSTFARQRLVDTSVCTITGIAEFIEQGLPAWCYFCCQPRGRWLNRLLDDSLAKIRMSGWLFYRWPIKGFLHWGYNFWYQPGSEKKIDPFTVADANHWPAWPHGDPFVVYPGKDGPLDSIRWEVFAESLQDYALLQTVGVSRDSAALASLRSFEDFPRTEQWLRRLRRRFLCSAQGGSPETHE